MGHRAVPLCLRCCAPASVLAEKQPLVDVDAGPCLAMDGRVYPVIGPNPYWETSIRAVAVRGSVLDGRNGMRRL
jgi:hypothetical protein